jgi:hypothetical protein
MRSSRHRTSFVNIVVLAFSSAVLAQSPPTFVPAGFERVGAIAPRHARDIAASNWSVGAETMGRDYTVYKHWREYLGPLGVKSARIQSGWAKTEKVAGQYDWAWMDEIMPDMVTQGVTPWVCLCYGNSIYEGGGSLSVKSPLPQGEALDAWDRYVRAYVERYGKYVHEWEIWNEPQHQDISVEDYAAFVVRTAAAIRDVQPDAQIIACASAGIGEKNIVGLLKILQSENKLDFVDTVTYHPYATNPDSVYPGVEKMRKAVAEIAPHATIFQGENGCPSTQATYGALSNKDWTELSQAKWALRRLLGDLGRDIRSSYFSIIDMHYEVDGEVRINTKGLIATNPDKTVAYLKPAYWAVQNISAVFDDKVQRLPDTGINVSCEGAAATDIAAFAYLHVNGGHLLTLWKAGSQPDNELTATEYELAVLGMPFANPVWVDMLTGAVYAIPPNRIDVADDTTAFSAISIGDWPILIAEAKALPSFAAE